MKDSDIELEATLQNCWARDSELLRSDWHDERTQDSRSFVKALVTQGVDQKAYIAS